MRGLAEQVPRRDVSRLAVGSAMAMISRRRKIPAVAGGNEVVKLPQPRDAEIVDHVHQRPEIGHGVSGIAVFLGGDSVCRRRLRGSQKIRFDAAVRWRQRVHVNRQEQIAACVVGDVRPLQQRQRVVVLTRHAQEAYVHEFLRVGASGYVLKQSRSSELLRAVHTVATGEKYIDPTLSGKVNALYRPRAQAGRQNSSTRVRRRSNPAESNGAVYQNAPEADRADGLDRVGWTGPSPFWTSGRIGGPIYWEL